MSIFLSIIKKESLHLVRDPRTVLIVLCMPIILLLLFGFAISTEVNNVDVGIVTDSHSQEVRDIVSRIGSSPYFTLRGMMSQPEIEPALRDGVVDAVLVLRESSGKVDHQVVADASNPNNAQIYASYLEGVMSRNVPDPALTTTLYNPQLKSSYNFVPGIMGMIFILICAMMTSVSIVREKESGTMNLLLVSPIKPRTIILGKLIPYFVLSLMILALMLAFSYTLLGIPFSVTALNTVWVSVLYIRMSLAIGLLISTVAKTQFNALVISGVLCIYPVTMLSGMLFPVENMPVALQWFSCTVPARWYIDAMRTLMIQQLDIMYVIDDIAILASITVLVITAAILQFSRNK